MRRVYDEANPELLDVRQPVNRKLEASLESLRVLNKYFGAYSLVRHFMRRWLERGRTYRMLDLATGFGDIPRMIVNWARKHGVSVRIDAVDRQPATLAIARRASAGLPGNPFHSCRCAQLSGGHVLRRGLLLARAASFFRDGRAESPAPGVRALA